MADAPLVYDDAWIRRILLDVKTIAMVGASTNEMRPSYFAMLYLQGKGYRVIPVNPRYAGQTLLGERVFPDLASIPFTPDMVQIFRRSEPNLSVLFGSVSGFLLLVFMAQFVFLHIEFAAPGSFAGLHDKSIPGLYRQFSYFSMVTLATVGYGDITPVSDTARLLTMFFAICGQFYLVALVGILVSRYSALMPNNQTSL